MPRVLTPSDFNLPRSRPGQITPAPHPGTAGIVEFGGVLGQIGAEEQAREQQRNYALAQAELNIRGATLQDEQQSQLDALMRDPNLTPQKIAGWQAQYRERLTAGALELSQNISSEFTLDEQHAAALQLNATGRLPGMFSQGVAAERALQTALYQQQLTGMREEWQNQLAADPMQLPAKVEEATDYINKSATVATDTTAEIHATKNTLARVAAEWHITKDAREFLQQQDMYKKAFTSEEQRADYVRMAENKIERERKLAEIEMRQLTSDRLELTRAGLAGKSNIAAIEALKAPVEDMLNVYAAGMNKFMNEDLQGYSDPHSRQLVQLYYQKPITEMARAQAEIDQKLRAGEEAVDIKGIISRALVTANADPYQSDSALKSAEAFLSDDALWRDVSATDRQKAQEVLRDRITEVTLDAWGQRKPDQLLQAIASENGSDNILRLFPHLDGEDTVKYLNSPSTAKLAKTWVEALALRAKDDSVLNGRYTPDPANSDDANYLDNLFFGSVTAPAGTPEAAQQHVDLVRSRRAMGPAQERQLAGQINSTDPKTALMASTAVMEVAQRYPDALEAAHFPIDVRIKAQRIVAAGTPERVEKILAEQPLSTTERQDKATYLEDNVLRNKEGRAYKDLQATYVSGRNEYWGDFEADLTNETIERGRARFEREVTDIYLNSRATLDEAKAIVQPGMKNWLGDDSTYDGKPRLVWNPARLHPSVRGLNATQLGDQPPDVVMRTTAVDDVAKRIVFDMKPDQWPPPMRDEWKSTSKEWLTEAHKEMRGIGDTRLPDPGARQAYAINSFARDWLNKNLRLIPMDTHPSTSRPAYWVAYHDEKIAGDQPLLTWLNKDAGTQTSLKWTFSYNKSPEYKAYQQRLIDIDADNTLEMLNAKQMQRTVDVQSQRGIRGAARNTTR